MFHFQKLLKINKLRIKNPSACIQDRAATIAPGQICGVERQLKVLKKCYYVLALVALLFLLETFLPVQLF